MNYEKKLQIADKYLMSICGLTWDDLPDINSLHECNNLEEIKFACQERLSDDCFPMDLIF